MLLEPLPMFGALIMRVLTTAGGKVAWAIGANWKEAGGEMGSVRRAEQAAARPRQSDVSPSLPVIRLFLVPLMPIRNVDVLMIRRGAGHWLIRRVVRSLVLPWRYVETSVLSLDSTLGRFRVLPSVVIAPAWRHLRAARKSRNKIKNHVHF